ALRRARRAGGRRAARRGAGAARHAAAHGGCAPGDRAAAPRAELLPYGQRPRARARRRPGPSAAPLQGDRDPLMSVALVNGRVLRKARLTQGRCVLIENGRILDIVAPSDRRVRRAERYDLGGQMLLPGFIDSQVNGGGGVLFNDAPTVETIRAIGRAHRRFGTTGFLPTLISADLDVVARAIAALRIALRCKAHDRFMLVTDAMPSVGTDNDSFELQGRRITVRGNVCLDEDGRLAGTNIDMASCVRNAISMLGVSLPQAVHMASQ